MTIFNIQIWGEDAENFCSLSNDDKIQWIKSHTNVNSDVIINEFLRSNYKGSKQCCAKCGEVNNQFIPNANFSKTVSESFATVTTDGRNTENGGSDSNERRATNKRRKAK